MKKSIDTFKRLFVSGCIILSGALMFSTGELVGENLAKLVEKEAYKSLGE